MPIDPNISVDTAHPKRGVPIVPSEISAGVILPTDKDFVIDQDNQAEAASE